MKKTPLSLAALFLLVSSSASAALHRTAALTETAVNSRLSIPVPRGARGPAALRAAILLDRAHFSCGEIDGIFGQNVARALGAFRSNQKLPQADRITAEDWQRLNADPAPALVRYTISTEDAAGPFVHIPLRMMAKAQLPAMGYQSLLEALGERFHSSPELLRRLNPGLSFTAGSAILVPNVRAAATPTEKATKVVVDGESRTVTAYGATGTLLASYPATIGSSHDPLPVGTWKILGVARHPTYHYNPKLFWDAQSGDTKAVIAAGPNNPVGSVWIDLSKPHYGLHGTPEPSAIGKTYSHGCIRLTNWDAEELAELVSPGVEAVLRDGE